MNVFNSFRSLYSICYPTSWKDWSLLAGGAVYALGTKSYAILGSVSAAYALYKYSGSPIPIQSDTLPILKNSPSASQAPTDKSDPSSVKKESVNSVNKPIPPRERPIILPSTSPKLVSSTKSSTPLERVPALSSIPRPVVPPAVQICPVAEIPGIVSSIGIPNGGSTCFLASMMQAKILKDSRLLKAFLDPAVGDILPNTQRFISQLIEDLQTGKSITDAAISAIRMDLYTISGDAKWLFGEHDACEALIVLSSPDAVANALNRHGFGYKQNCIRYWDFPDGIVPVNALRDLDFNLYLTQREETFYAEEIALRETDIGQQIEKLLLGNNEGIRDFRFQVTNTNDPTESEHIGTYRFTKKQWLNPPPRFSINLKRHRLGNTDLGEPPTVKVNVPVDVKDQIALSPTLFHDGIARTYELVSFIEHIGMSAGSGHYVAYIKENGKWFRYSDSDKREVTSEFVAQKRNIAYSFDWQLVSH